MPSKASFLRQISGRESWNWNPSSSSKRWNIHNNNNIYSSGSGDGGGYERSLRKMEGFNMYGGGDNGGGYMMRKRVMVVVDNTSCAKHAMMWALTHLTNKGDLLTLLHIISPHQGQSHERDSSSSSSYLASSLGTLCKACKPEVEVEALMIQGPKLATVLSQVKKLEVSVLVLGQKKPSSFLNCFCMSTNEDFVDECINNAECLTLGVKKQSRGMGGYLISSRWQKNFWLLA